MIENTSQTLPLVECRRLTKNYGGKTALSDINLSIPPGRMIGLLGPNGSGKTTLIKLISGLLTPTFGEVFVKGRPIGVGTKKIVSYLPERTYLSNWMRVNDMIDYFADFYDDFSREAAREMLLRLDIKGEDKLKTMSKGTREKVQLILVMSRDADLFLLDEPIGGVDPAARDYILDTILSNYNKKASMIISTHLIWDIEKVLDEAIFLKYGNIVKYDTVENINKSEGKSLDEYFREVFRC